jgi:hypothetical protein
MANLTDIIKEPLKETAKTINIALLLDINDFIYGLFTVRLYFAKPYCTQIMRGFQNTVSKVLANKIIIAKR